MLLVLTQVDIIIVDNVLLIKVATAFVTNCCCFNTNEWKLIKLEVKVTFVEYYKPHKFQFEMLNITSKISQFPKITLIPKITTNALNHSGRTAVTHHTWIIAGWFYSDNGGTQIPSQLEATPGLFRLTSEGKEENSLIYFSKVCCVQFY